MRRLRGKKESKRMIAGKSAAELQKLLDLVKAMRDVDTAIAPEIGEHILVPKVIPDPKELQNLHDIAHDLHMQEWESKKGRDVVKTMQKNMEEAYPYLVAYGLKSKKITIKELTRFLNIYSMMEIDELRKEYFTEAWEDYTKLRHRCEIYCEGECIPRFINKAASEIFTLVNDTLNKNQKE